MFFDYWYMVLVIPAILFGAFAQARVSSTFRRFSQVQNLRGLTGAEVAQQILARNALHQVRVERVSGNLTDHYDPRANVIRLSDSVYDSHSVAAIGVAAHETGHALQYASHYAPIQLRAAIIPLTTFSSHAAPILILLGFIFFEPLIPVGIILFSVIALFQLVTLPVEFNASNRALQTLEGDRILSDTELGSAKQVLSAAALTYVAALVVALANILRLILIYNQRRD